jgi:hypothetical protein
MSTSRSVRVESQSLEFYVRGLVPFDFSDPFSISGVVPFEPDRRQ